EGWGGRDAIQSFRSDATHPSIRHAYRVALYRDVIGFEIVTQSRPGDCFDWALLRMGGASLMLNIAHESHARPATPDAARVGRAWRYHTVFRRSRLGRGVRILALQRCRSRKPVVRDYGI